jgi:hypothetical protein
MSLYWEGLFHERLAVIATFAYSQVPLAKLRGGLGSSRFFEKIIHEIPHQTATQATVDLALYFRGLDDEQHLTDYWEDIKKEVTVGRLWLKDGKTKPLSPREMCNKIIHGERIEWDLSSHPKIICIARDKEYWSRAEIELDLLLALGGQLGS